MTDRDAFETGDALAATLRSARADAFAPGFADRVLARLAAPRAPSLTRVLERQFLYLAPAAAAAIILIALANLHSVGRSSVAAALGIAPVTVAEAYSESALSALPP